MTTKIVEKQVLIFGNIKTNFDYQSFIIDLQLQKASLTIIQNYTYTLKHTAEFEYYLSFYIQHFRILHSYHYNS